MKILGLDTCGGTAACALTEDGTVLAEERFLTKKAHSQVILPMTLAMLDKCGMTLEDVDLFAAVTGPGSYTGLRIGISTIQGICFANGRPCAGVSALESLAFNAAQQDRVTIASLMYARADLYYTAFFSCEGYEIERLTEDAILPAQKVHELSAAYSQTGTVIAVRDTHKLLPEGSTPLPAHLNGRSAVSLCAAAARKAPISPDKLLPDYLAVTQAEKELEGGVKN